MNSIKLLEEFSRLLNSKVKKIEIVDYSEKSIAVFGNTIAIKDKLKEMGGKYNANLKKDKNVDIKEPGWIFIKSKKDEVSKFIEEIQGESDGVISLSDAKSLLEQIYK